MARHHPPEEMLLDYAAGALGEAESLVVATHLALCPACRSEVAAMEAVGGALLETIPAGPETSPGLDDVLARVMARLDDPAPAPTRAAARSLAAVAAAPLLPEPLRSYVGGDPGGISWTPVMRGLDERPIDLGARDAAAAKVRMMRIHPATAMPQHTHRGREMTLVLAGGFRDATGHYLRGDLALTDASVDHTPVADDDEACVCLVLTEAPVRLTGVLGRLFNPFVRF
jgi:putative transcriptional regulator